MSFRAVMLIKRSDNTGLNRMSSPHAFITKAEAEKDLLEYREIVSAIEYAWVEESKAVPVNQEYRG